MKPTREEAEAAITTLLLWTGEDPTREGLLNTPKRVIKAYEEFFSGYNISAKEILNTVFEDIEESSEPILVRDIAFFSHCEHHLVPIIGKAHISYLPDKKLLGLSKFGRLVDMYAKRMQTQEHLTANISNAIMTYLKPKGVAVLLEAEHMCMSMRGVKKQNTSTITTSFKGVYSQNKDLCANFYNLLKI